MKRTISLFLLLALAVSLCACGQKADEPATWQEQYDLGMRYLSEGEYEQAILAFEAAIEIDPKQADAYIGLAEVYTARGDTNKAVDILERALEECEETDQVSGLLSRLQEDAGNLPELELTVMDFSYEEGGELADLNPTAVGEVWVEFTAPAEISLADVCILPQDELDEPSWWTEYSDAGVEPAPGTNHWGIGVPVFPWEGGAAVVMLGYNGRNELVGYSVIGSVEDAWAAQSGEDDQSGREPLMGPVGTLELSDFSYSYTPGGRIVENNEGAVGGLSLSFTVNGPEPVRDVLIATWYDRFPSQVDIDQMVERMPQIWKEAGLTVYNDSLPFQVYENTRPVDAEELGKTSYILLIGIDQNCNAAGYSIVSAEIPG